MDLLLGAGSSLVKLIVPPAHPPNWVEGVITLDSNPAHNPDVLWDLNRRPLPFPSDTFGGIHAYEVLEHLGRQGDAVAFFAEFHEYWRILRKDGLLIATVPSHLSPWAWGDPSHTRIITEGTLMFLDQTQYAQVGRTPMSDFRPIWAGDFETVWCGTEADQLAFILRAIKPARTNFSALNPQDLK